MDTQLIQRHFARMGARFKITRPVNRRGWSRESIDSRFTVNIGKDNRGEFFDLSLTEKAEETFDAGVIHVVPEERHLLFLVRNNEANTRERFLCGHDERAWFVAAVPGTPVTVREAREELKPAAVIARQHRFGIRAGDRNRRRNEAFVRQGEWFFLADPTFEVDPKRILRNEPIRRGSGKPHMVAEVYRTGGEAVYVSRDHPNGVTYDEYVRLRHDNPQPPGGWRQMFRNPRVYARGTVRHADHKTIALNCWHEVLMNTESQAPSMAQVAFLD